MRKEIIKLLERVAKQTGYAESTLSLRFGNSHAAKRIRTGSASLNTAERFLAWLKKEEKKNQ